MYQKKRELRLSMLEARNSMSSDEVEAKSSAICDRLLELPEFRTARLVMAYMDFRNEVKTGDFLRECVKRGKRIALPVVFDSNRGTARILAYETDDIGKCIKKGKYGIYEPDIESTSPVDAQEIDLVIVPGVAFDGSMRRLGYGAGYYDRFLKNVRSDCKSVGIAFELQLAGVIPYEAHDTTLDMIVTESRILRKFHEA